MTVPLGRPGRPQRGVLSVMVSFEDVNEEDEVVVSRTRTPRATRARRARHVRPLLSVPW